MFGWGPGGGWFDGVAHVLWGIGSFFVGLIFFLIWVAILVLLVRFLLIGTRAAKAYLRSQGEPDGLLAPRASAAAPATTVAPTTVTPVTKPAPRTRTPKAPL